MKDWFDDYGNADHRKSVVEHHLARIGLSLDDPGSRLTGPADPPKPETYGPALPDWWRWRHEFAWGGTYPVSQTLAKQLGAHHADFT